FLTRSATSRLCSISVTSWPRSLRSDARCRPTLPAPEMTTFIRAPLPRTRSHVLCHRLEERVETSLRVRRHHEVRHVALLKGTSGERDETASAALDADHGHLA